VKLYSIPDVTHLVQELLHTKNFATVPVKKGVVDIKQIDASGRVSQTFRITIKSPPADPV
jgi:hypothetical protein